MKDGESMKDDSSKVMKVVNQMKIYGDIILDQRIVQKVLVSLTKHFNTIISIIEESRDLSNLSVTELFGSLLAHEAKFSKRAEGSTEGAFQIRHQAKLSKQKGGKGKDKYFEKERKNVRAYNGYMGNASHKRKFPPYGTCGKTNHPEKDCWFKGKL